MVKTMIQYLTITELSNRVIYWNSRYQYPLKAVNNEGWLKETI